MSDENINPQNIPIQPQDNSLVENKPPFLNSKKIILIIFFIVLFIIVSISLFVFYNRTSIIPPSEPIPTSTPEATDTPFPTQETGEFLITIKLGETIIIPNTTISLTYSSADTPGDNCYDCTSSTTLEIKNNNQVTSLIYSCGGFTGECTTIQEAYGYKFEIIDQPGKDILKLKIKKVE